MKRIPSYRGDEEESKKFRSDSETQGAVVSILNNPTSQKYQNIPSMEGDCEDENTLMPLNSTEF